MEEAGCWDIGEIGDDYVGGDGEFFVKVVCDEDYFFNAYFMELGVFLSNV